MRNSPSRLTVLVALPFVLVLVGDVVDNRLERRRGERDVLVGATVRFEAFDRPVRLARLAEGGAEHGVALGDGWTAPVGGGLGVSAGGAGLRVALPVDGPTFLRVEARRRGGATADARLRVAVAGVELGGIRLDRDWTEGTFELPRPRVRRGAVEVRFDADPEVEALVRRVAVTAARSAGLDDLDRDPGFEHDARDGWLALSRPGRAVVAVDAAPAAGRLVARTRFLSSDGRLPAGHARLEAWRVPGDDGGAGPLAAAELDATAALWRDLSLDVPAGVPVTLAVTVSALGDGDQVVLESVWRRPD